MTSEIKPSDINRIKALQIKINSVNIETITDMAEVVDTAADGIEIIMIVEKAAKPGLGLVSRVITLATVEPIIQEVIKDVELALAAIKEHFQPDLGRDLAHAIFNEVSRRGAIGPVSKWFVNTFLMVGDGIEIVDQIVDKIKADVIAPLEGYKDNIMLYIKGGDMSQVVPTE